MSTVWLNITLRLTVLLILPFWIFGIRCESDFFKYYFSQKIKFETFNVPAGSLDQLKQKLLSGSGPKDPHGQHRYAVTRWGIKWNWPLSENQRADFSRSSVNGDVKVIVPKWIVEQSGGDNSVELGNWQQVYIKLLNHELDHAVNALKTADLIKKRLQNLDKQGVNDPNLGNLIARKLVSENHSWDRDYDVQTGHGKTQGIN